MEKYYELLSKIELFKNIEPSDLDQLLGCLNAEVKRFSKNEFIWLAGDKPENIGIVLEGMVQIVREDIMGVRTILKECSSGELFGEAFPFLEIKAVPVSVVAIEDSEVLLLKGSLIAHSCGTACTFHQSLIRNMLFIMSRKNLYLNQQTEILSERSIRNKILTYLSILASQKNRDTIYLPFNRQELADYLAVDRSAMSTELGKMKKEGIINFEKNKFQILNIDK